MVDCMYVWMMYWWVWVCYVHIHESVYEYVHLNLAHVCRIVEGWGIGVETCIQACEMVLVVFQWKGFLMALKVFANIYVYICMYMFV